MSEPSVAELRNRLDGLTIRDAARLGRRIKNLRGKVSAEKVQQIAEELTSAEALVATRKAAVPAITYSELPVSDRRDELAKAINDNQVVVVAGETGVGQDHPAAERSAWSWTAESAAPSGTLSRVALPPAPSPSASPTNWARPLGDAVGYTVRFTDQASDRTLVKLMTDGILLAQDRARPPPAALRHPDPR